MSEWVDFKALRKNLPFAEVLKFYGVEVKARGNRHQGFCPLPTHTGKRRSPSFSAKLDWGVWQCFGCRASGNILDFALRMEGHDPRDEKALRTVALKLQAKFGAPKTDKPASKVPPASPKLQQAPVVSVVVNAPLDFMLKDLDPKHPYLRERGFQPDTIDYFGVGYCARGLMQGRVAIPIHDAADNLVGYAGRMVNEAQINEEHPKYLLPAPRERAGRRMEFHKSELVYNANRLFWPMEDIIVVEGFPSVWWLTQWGWPDVVSVMGSSMSQAQAQIILSALIPDGRLWILTDGDPGGEACATTALSLLAPHRFCRWLKLKAGQPTDLTPGDLEKLLQGIPRKEAPYG